MVYITHIRTQDGERAEHITHVRWHNTSSGSSNTSTKAQMVDYINGGSVVYVKGSARDVPVRVVNANPPYLRTEADGRETNNLLSLPHF